MVMRVQHSRHRFRVPVDTRVTASGDGDLVTVRAVYCLEEGRSIPLETCATCAHCEVVHMDDDNQSGEYIECQSTDGKDPRDPVPATRRDAEWELTDRLGRTEVVQVMNGSVVSARTDLSIDAVRALLLEREIGGMPVVDDGGKPVGIITKSDLLRTADATPRPATVADVMTLVPLAISEHTTLSQAAAHMAFEGLHRLPVVSEEGLLVGILSAIDILRWLARLDGFLMPDQTERQSQLD